MPKKLEERFCESGNSSLIDSWTEEEIDIRSFDLVELEFSLPFTKKGSVKENFYGKNLVVKNCPNLKILDLHGLKLTGLKIENCPKLTILNFSHNQINEINLTKLTSLENLYCSGNRLVKLDLSKNLSLENLVCNNNDIWNLDVKHLKNLKSLYCFSCCLSELDCIGLENLKELYCAGNKGTSKRLKILNVVNCESLEILDCAENDIEFLFLYNLKNLNFVSCRQNSLKKLIISNCDNLESLDCFLQGWLINVDANELETKVYINSFSKLRTLYVDEETEIFSAENQPLYCDELPQLEILEVSGEEIDLATKKEDKAYYSDEEQNNNFPKYTTDNENQAWLDKWLELQAVKDKKKLGELDNYKNQLTTLDLSWQKLKGEIVLKDFPKLKSLNLGNNLLKKIVLKNCPELVRLIASHNPLTSHIKKINCPKLTDVRYFSDKNTINLSENTETKTIEQLQAEIEQEQTLLDLEREKAQKTEEYNNKVYSLLQKNEEDITFDEIHELITEFKLINPDYKEQFLTLYKIKFRARFPELYKKQPKKQETKPNYKKLYHDLLAKVKSGKITVNNKSEITNSLLSKEKKEELYKLLANQNTSQEKQPTNRSFIISISVLSVIALALLAKILQDNIKIFLKKSLKLTNEFKRKE